jgi:hypothetical protein
MFDNCELTSMRAAFQELLPDTCNILSITRTSDSAGGWSEAAGTVASNVPCRIDFAKGYGKEAVSNSSLTPYKSGTLSLAWDQTITTAHQVQMGTVVYNVTGVNDAASWILIKRCSVERVP